MKRLLLVLTLITLFTGTLLAQTATLPAGAGTAGDPYQIATLNNLYWLTQNSAEWDKHYLQTANIDASSTNVWDSGAGFSPIGNGSNNFEGSYDGGSYTIDGLYIDRSSTDYIGLFGYITDGSTIQNLGLIDVTINGNSYVGGLAGYFWDSSTMSACYTTGNVSGLLNNVGGLVGYSGNSCEISNCYSTGSVSGLLNNVGGFVGVIGSSTISNCYSTGDVTGSWQNVGGFVGQNELSLVQNCYSRGNVTRSSGSTESEYGAFCGFGDSGTIEYCYTTGSVFYEGEEPPTDKGFVGEDENSPTYTNNFWDIEASNQFTATGATDKTTGEMKDVSTFTSTATAGLDAPWDFVTDPYDDLGTNDWWDMDPTPAQAKTRSLAKVTAIDDGYPFLGWQNGEDIALPVELSLFTVEATNEGVLCKWTTESEIENLGFMLERKTEGTGWSEVAGYKTNDELLGQGTTSSYTDYEYLDVLVEPNTTYEYRLADVDYGGIVTYHATREVITNKTSLSSTIESFTVLPSFPNPFNPSTTITYGLDTDCKITVQIYDITGQLITTLLNTEQTQGWHSVVWNGTNQHGELAPAGIYISKITSGNEVKTAKLMLLK